MQEPRQLYGLGSIVKKAVRGVKKVVKSPLGKAAIGGALMFGIPGTGIGGLFGRASLGGGATGLFGQKGIGATFGAAKAALANRFGPANFVMNRDGPVNKASFLSKLNPFGKNFDAKTAFLTGGAGLVAAPFLMDAFAPEEIEEEDIDVMDPRYQVQRAKNYYSGLGDKGAGLDFMPQKKYVQPNFYAADGGRAGYANGMMVEEDDEEEFIRSGAGQRFRQPKAFLNMGGDAGRAQAEQMLMAEFVKYKNKGGTLSFEQFVKAVMQASQQPEGAGMEQPQPVAMAANGGLMTQVPGYTTPEGYNKFDYPSGGKEVRVGKQEGGIMEAEASEMIDMGGLEKDFRNEGGFVAMGGKERADDVPARLSKNEFVFTADAVRNAGGGDIDKGAEVMENLMNNLEQGGEVSEDSQGLEGAQAMYDQQQMLQSRMI